MRRLAVTVAAALALTGGLLGLAGIQAHPRPEIHLTVTAHDIGVADKWFTTNKTDGRNPAIDLQPGARVHLDFVVDGDARLQHNFTLHDPVGFEMPGFYGPEEASEDDPKEFTFTVPWDAPQQVHYDCDLHVEDMQGDASVQGPGNAAPSLDVTAPDEGATVAGTVQVEGTAADADGDDVAVQVTFPDGTTRSADGQDPWTLSWNTTSVDDGSHRLEIRAEDAHGAVREASRNVTVSNAGDAAPTVSIRIPQAGAEVAGPIRIAGSASDPDGDLARVEVQVPPGEAWQPASGTTSWSLDWNASRAGLGEQTIRVRALDAAEATSTVSRTVRVVESATNRAPSVTVDRPEPGATVRGPVEIAGSAGDPDGDPLVVEVDPPGPDGWRSAEGPGDEGRWRLVWNSSTVPPGDHDIRVRARDGRDRSPTAVRTVSVAPPRQDDGPAVTFQRPRAGATVAYRVPVVVAVETGVDAVRVGWPNASAIEATPIDGGRWIAHLPLTGRTAGAHDIVATASTDDGTDRARRTVRVRPATAPEVAVGQDPPDVVDGRVRIAGTVRDDRVRSPPLDVELRVDGERAYVHQSPDPGRFVLPWDARSAGPGEHTLAVQAFDGTAASEPVRYDVRVPGSAPEPAAGATTPGPTALLTVLALGGLAALARQRA